MGANVLFIVVRKGIMVSESSILHNLIYRRNQELRLVVVVRFYFILEIIAKFRC